MPQIRVGIGGWNFAPWRGRFFPDGLPQARELHYASRQLSSIEINGTFYRHQPDSSFAKWATETPEDFIFAVKAHRATTHGKILAEAGPAIERFLGSGLATLGRKLGPILWQFPPTRKFDVFQASAFLDLLPAEQAGIALRHAIEARHPSFDDPAWGDLLRKRGVARVIVDRDEQTLHLEQTAGFVYARLQRNSAEAPEGYASAALDEWAEKIRHWRSAGADCFVYFISGEKAFAPRAAVALMERIKKKGLLF